MPSSTGISVMVKQIDLEIPIRYIVASNTDLKPAYLVYDLQKSVCSHPECQKELNVFVKSVKPIHIHVNDFTRDDKEISSKYITGCRRYLRLPRVYQVLAWSSSHKEKCKWCQSPDEDFRHANFESDNSSGSDSDDSDNSFVVDDDAPLVYRKHDREDEELLSLSLEQRMNKLNKLCIHVYRGDEELEIAEGVMYLTSKGELCRNTAVTDRDFCQFHADKVKLPVCTNIDEPESRRPFKRLRRVYA